MEVPPMKNLQKQKTKPEVNKLERPRRARPEAALIKPAEGMMLANSSTEVDWFILLNPDFWSTECANKVL